MGTPLVVITGPKREPAAPAWVCDQAEHERLVALHQQVQQMYAAGGHITRATVKAALDGAEKR